MNAPSPAPRTLAERIAARRQAEPAPAPVPEWVRRANERRLVAKELLP